MIRSKRVCERASPEDGYRVLVDRLWPRGLTREAAHLDEWLWEVAPSDDLRRWFGHDPARWDEFRRRHRGELSAPAVRPLLGALARRAAAGTVTLLDSARDQHQNQAVALAEVLVGLA